MGSALIFIPLAVIAVVAALGMLLTRNAVHSALFLILNFATIAVFYIVLNAPFIAMVQITIYAGAIVVLFLFVIMLLGAEQLGGVHRSGGQYVLAAVLAVALLAMFGVVLLQGGEQAANAANVIDTSPVALGMRLFEGYVFPFELTGLLLLAAMIGVVVLSKGRGSDA